MFMKIKEIGKIGEEYACDYLKQKQYKIVERNFKCRQGEIDIIAIDNKMHELVFIEVKSRTNLTYGIPSESVNSTKKKHIYKTAKYYLYKNKLENVAVRLDVIEVYLYRYDNRINHIKQAF